MCAVAAYRFHSLEITCAARGYESQFRVFFNCMLQEKAFFPRLVCKYDSRNVQLKRVSPLACANEEARSFLLFSIALHAVLSCSAM